MLESIVFICANCHQMKCHFFVPTTCHHSKCTIKTNKTSIICLLSFTSPYFPTNFWDLNESQSWWSTYFLLSTYGNQGRFHLHLNVLCGWKTICIHKYWNGIAKKKCTTLYLDKVQKGNISYYYNLSQHHKWLWKGSLH